MREARNLADVDVLVNHYWVEERMPIQSWDKDTGRLTSTRRSIFALRLGFGPEWASYRLENLFEALESPGGGNPRDDLQVCHTRELGQDLVLNTFGEVGVALGGV